MFSRTRRGRAGFTLVELLIVVLIIGILASLAVVRFNRVKQRGQLAAVQSDLRNMSVAQEAYQMDNMVYTSNLSDLEFDNTSGVNITITVATNTGWAATATHTADPSIQCGIFVGTATAASASPATDPEVVSCTF